MIRTIVTAHNEAAGRGGGVTTSQTDPSRDSAIPVVLLLLALASLLAIIFILNWNTTHRNLVITGGLAGTAASTIAVLLNPHGTETLQRTLRQHGPFAAYLSPVAGFVSGAFSVLAALGLFTPDGDRTPVAAAAIFGGVFGLVVAPSISAAVFGRGDATGSSHSVLASAVKGLEGVVSPVPIANYDGYVKVMFKRTDQRLVIGTITGQLLPRSLVLGEQMPQTDLARLLVQGGEDRPSVDFLITVVGTSHLSAYPRSSLISAPIDDRSDEFEFSLVREDILVEARDERWEVSRASDVILLDVSQGGRTFQLVELPLEPPGPGVATGP